jgi:diguanylate cyclase (GGDEF)-like protein/PAS domain S-box-containing protein
MDATGISLVQKDSTRFAQKHSQLSLLFVFHNSVDTERCLQELSRVGFRVSADFVSTPEQLSEHLDKKQYDAVLAENLLPWPGPPAIELLRRVNRYTPLIFVTKTVQLEIAAELVSRGAADCIDMDRIGYLPVAIRRALAARNLSEERDQVEQMLRHSEAHYRALVGNLSYGICRCETKGHFLEVNEALRMMLGYASADEVKALGLAVGIMGDPDQRKRMLGHGPWEEQPDPLEVDWRRKDGTPVRVRLSGREVIGEQGGLGCYEIIVENVTKQRELEEQLRQQAAKDSLTGLINYRHLVDVLDSEIRRSIRTGREFTLLLFDLDQLKKINDSHGHATGSSAICRVADALSMGCRDIDTAARYGGDEFALVLPETDAVSANLVARRMCESLAHDGKDPKLSMSAGVAVYPKDGSCFDELLTAADRVMYQAKGRRR